MISIDLFLYILAAVLFCLAGFGVPRFAWQWLACACLVLSLIL